MVEPQGKGKAARVRARVVEEADAIVGDLTAEAAPKPPPSRPKAAKAKARRRRAARAEDEVFNKTATPKPPTRRRPRPRSAGPPHRRAAARAGRSSRRF